MKKFLKAVYSKIPYKKHLFLLLKVFSLPKSIYQHLHFTGIFNIKNHQNSTFKMFHHGNSIENEVFWAGLYGNWEKDSLMLWSKLSETAGVIFDIGANTGIYSILAKSINPNAIVYAFEPVPKIHKKLQLNTNINQFDNRNENLAVSNNSCQTIIYDTEGEHSYSASLDNNFRGEDHKLVEIPIECTRLDDYIEKHQIDNIDLIKVDVESLEAQVLEGMGEYLQAFQPSILIEILTDDVAKKIEGLIAGINYCYINLDEKGNFEAVEHLTSSKFHNFLICHPDTAARVIPK